MRKAEAAVMETAAMEYVAAVEATAMKAARMHAAAVPTSTAVEAAAAHMAAASTMPAASAVPAATAMPATHFGDEAAGSGVRRRHHGRTDRRHGLSALARRGREHQHRCRRKAEAADEAAPWICASPHI